MLIKRVCSAMAALAAFAAVSVAAVPAHAAGTCSVLVPAKVYISSGTTVITARPGSDCSAAGMESASWAISPSDYGDSFDFYNGSLSSTYTFYTDLDRLGTHHAVPTGASSSNGFNDIAQNSPSFVIKYRSYAYASSARSGTRVHVHGLIRRWSNNGLIAPSGRTVYLQRYSAGAWHTLSGYSRTTDAAGHVEYYFTQASAYHYRVYALESSYVWGTNSASTYR